jgi:hypothetical protein
LKAAVFLAVAVGLSTAARPALAADTLAVKWNDVLLEAVRESHPGSPMAARAIAVVHTCGFDAWSAYDAAAVGTRPVSG